MRVGGAWTDAEVVALVAGISDTIVAHAASVCKLNNARAHQVEQYKTYVFCTLVIFVNV